jgi:hypothetical protein
LSFQLPQKKILAMCDESHDKNRRAIPKVTVVYFRQLM